MQVLTFLTNEDHPGFKKNLQPSCDYHKLDLIILEYEGDFTTHRLKDEILYEYLQVIPEDEIILFSDGHDTMLMADEREILKKYFSFKVPLVFSAEVNCWPSEELKSRYTSNHHHFNYLNSGAFIGEAGFIKSLYEKYPLFSPHFDSRYDWSNQYYWHHTYLENKGQIRLDHNCELFYNTSIPAAEIKGIDFRMQDNPKIKELILKEKLRLDEEILFSNSRISNKITNTRPCHLHLPGPVSKLLMESNYFNDIRPWA